MIEKIICSKWTKRIINLILVVNIIILYYIFLFVGYGNTSVDDVCWITGIVFMIVQIVRSFIKECIILKYHQSEVLVERINVNIVANRKDIVILGEEINKFDATLKDKKEQIKILKSEISDER